jgi:hypothetical protein
VKHQRRHCTLYACNPWLPLAKAAKWITRTSRVMTILLLLLFSLPTFAEEVRQDMLCAVYKPPENVAYQPGVDVHGNPVVPADLNDRSDMAPDVVQVPVTIDLAQRFDKDWAQGMEMATEMAMIEIHKDGLVLFNEKDITMEVAAFCEGKETEAESGVIVTDMTDDEIISGEGY